MTRRPTFRDAVFEDLEKARRWYEKQRTGLGDEFPNGFRDAANDLTLRPLTAGMVYREVRRFPLKRFPYGIFHRIVHDELIVVAVPHGRPSMRRLRNHD